MSWLLHLYETYKTHASQVGIIEKRFNEQEYTLLPIAHTTQNAHIEVTVTRDGEIHSAEVITVKSNMSTLIPCTEKSASRAGSVVAPYPLHDKLSYVTGDLIAYGGEKKKEDPFAAYIKQLKGWADSSHAVDKVRSIYQYVSKGTLIQDLIKLRILHVDDNNRLINKWDKSNETTRPLIYSVLTGDLDSAFIRFNVYAPGDHLTDVWKDPEMYDSFIHYYNEQLGDTDLCYVTGELKPSTDRHANKIRNAADKAKLISANDSNGFTYRGRFRTSQEAASISYEVSQKAHNALKWLINRQGKVIDQRVFLVWGDERTDIPSFADDAFDTAPSAAIVKQVAYTNQEFAAEFAKALDGYSNHLAKKGQSEVHIMVLDSATTGRMAVLYYRSMDKHLYLNKLIDWHTSCVWLHRYRSVSGERVQFYGAPSTKDIAFAAYGPKAGDKIVKGLMERMLPCIVDGRDIPLDIWRSAFNRASNPVSMERWEWEKTLSIACALINKREGRNVALDTENDDRNYLFGRMLAIADVLERRALGDEDRSSNAIRYMNAFSRHPERTWGVIQQSLQPYQARLGWKALDLNKLLDEVGSMMKAEDFNNEPLTGLYLLGFYSQRHALYQRKDKKEEAAEASKE